MRKTKIVCTIGPASTDEKIITDMCKAGMNVARLNFSHGTHEEQQKKIDIIKKVRTKLNLPIAVMLDTKGPEYRIRTFKDGKIELKAGAPFTFTTDEVEGNQTIVSVSYKNLNKDLNVGDRILLNNGLMEFVVKEIKGNNIITEVTVGGVLSDRKSMSFPNKVLKQKYLSEQDKQDILFGIKNEVAYIACSFVSQKQDLLDVKQFLKENDGEDIDLIAKIENQAGVDNIEEICEACEGIMIGRGDMGVEIAYEELPAMAKIAERTEQSIHYDKRFRNFDFQIRNEIDAISHATCGMAIDMKAKGIAVCTLSGMTARMISRFRSPVDIVGLTTNEKTWRKLALSWGVTPIMVEEFDSTEVLFYTAKKTAKEVLGLEKDDRIVITGGYTNGTSGNTNLIKVERI